MTVIAAARNPDKEVQHSYIFEEGTESLGKVGLQRLSLRKNVLWSFVGDTVYCGCMWVMLMTMTKLLVVLVLMLIYSVNTFN
jgi:hypothetical protein